MYDEIQVKDLKNGWFSIGEKDKCYFCGYDKVLSEHHIIRKCDGGTNEKNNIIIICPNCHALIHRKKYFVKFSNGYLFLVNSYDFSDVIKPINARKKGKRELPISSLKNAVKKGRLEQHKGKFKIKKKVG